MSVHSRSYPNLYKDSVSLMTVSAKVLALPGIEAASVVMASAANVENLRRVGLGDFAVRPNDLVVAVSGTDEACVEALQKADELLSAKPGGGNDDGWLIVQCLDGGTERASFALFDAARVDAGPVARIHLPHHLPISFHGWWKAD